MLAAGPVHDTQGCLATLEPLFRPYSLENLLLHQLCAAIGAACVHGALLYDGHLLSLAIHSATAAEHQLWQQQQQGQAQV